jgi:chromosome segregation ATPase
MDSLLNSLDNLEQATNEVQKIADDDARARVEMEAMMKAIIAVISEIQKSLNELKDLQDAAKDVAKLKGKIAQNNQKQNELLKKINALKDTLIKSPNIRNLQEQLQNLKTNLQDNLPPPGNSSNQTQAEVDDYNADFANSQQLGPPGSDQELQEFTRGLNQKQKVKEKRK